MGRVIASITTSRASLLRAILAADENLFDARRQVCSKQRTMRDGERWMFARSFLRRDVMEKELPERETWSYFDCDFANVA